MVQELKLQLVCECGESLRWMFSRMNNTVGDDEITLTVYVHKCEGQLSPEDYEREKRLL